MKSLHFLVHFWLFGTITILSYF